ncbi:MAG: hypothetical protein GY751_22055 [Bacteroidetes bacterium]|nr:hypothetical protein [Bacteroidota bacterium]
MNIRNLLETDYSKPCILEIANFIGSDPERFSVLMQLVLASDPIMAQRAAWAVSHCLDYCPSLADPYMAEMMDLLDQDVHNAVHRCVLRSLETVKLPVKYHGIIIDKAFRFLMNRKAAFALRVYAMTAIYRLSFTYPEIRQEFELVVNEELEYGSAGFRSRGRKMLVGKYKLRNGAMT